MRKPGCAEPPYNDPEESHPYLDRILLDIGRLAKRSRKSATLRARQNILNALGKLTERFRASSSYLFLRDWTGTVKEPWINPGNPITLNAHHNTGILRRAPDQRLPQAQHDGKGSPVEQCEPVLCKGHNLVASQA